MREKRRRLDDVLGIVQQEQERSALQIPRQALLGRALAGLVDVERAGDRRRDLLRPIDLRQRNEATPSAKRPPTRRAASTASRDFPTPPGPVKVTSLTSSRPSSAATSSVSRRRPIYEVSATGS
jgi:hypothetical protein